MAHHARLTTQMDLLSTDNHVNSNLACSVQLHFCRATLLVHGAMQMLMPDSFGKLCTLRVVSKLYLHKQSMQHMGKQ